MRFKDFITEDVDLIGWTTGAGETITADTPDTDWHKSFYCTNINLTSLRGAPRIIYGDFNCASNHLSSLEYGPSEVVGHYDCSSNKLKTLKGVPKDIDGNFVCTNNLLTSFKDGPERVNGDFYARHNSFTSLHDIHKHIKKIDGTLYISSNPIKSHVLGLLLIDGLKKIISDPEWDSSWGRIVTKYIGKGRKGMLDCQNELIEDGFEAHAQL